MIDRRMAVEEAVARYVRRGQTIMVGGFGRGGVPFTTIQHMAALPEELNDLTLIKNDANEPGIGIDSLLQQGQVKKLISTHLGLNPDFIRQMNDGVVECDLIPQGIFAEKIRAGGSGIPAILTDIGIGTEVEAGRETFVLDGRKLLVERALRADVTLIRADVADHGGNAWWKGSNRNMCVVMGMAADRVILESREIVAVGEIAGEDVHLPGVFVDAVVASGPLPHGGGPS